MSQKHLERKVNKAYPTAPNRAELRLEAADPPGVFKRLITLLNPFDVRFSITIRNDDVHTAGGQVRIPLL